MKTIGYKLSNNFKCQSLTYEVNKEYKISSMKICGYGFHYCENPLDTLDYYTFNKDSVLLKVEVLGDIKTKYNKSVTNHIKVLEVIDTSNIPDWPIIKYDKNNNLIHYKNSDKYEYWKTYDQNNNLIHYKNSNKYEEWIKYDKNNNLIHFKNSKGYEYWNKYDKNNNLIYFKNSDSYEKWYEYDKNNNLIHYKNSDNYEEWNKYDSNNNLIHFKNSNGFEYWKKYDSNNNLVYYKNSNNIEWSIEII